jgi:hypothetical protein
LRDVLCGYLYPGVARRHESRFGPDSSQVCGRPTFGKNGNVLQRQVFGRIEAPGMYPQDLKTIVKVR